MKLQPVTSQKVNSLFNKLMFSENFDQKFWEKINE